MFIGDLKRQDVEEFFDKLAGRRESFAFSGGVKFGIFLTILACSLVFGFCMCVGLLEFRPARDTTAVPPQVGNGATQTGPLGAPSGPVPAGGLPTPLNPVPGLPPGANTRFGPPPTSGFEPAPGPVPVIVPPVPIIRPAPPLSN